MVYEIIYSEDKLEWCGRMSQNGLGPFGNMWIFYSMVNFVSFIALLCWARSQYLAKTSGFYTPDAIIIFPVYLKILVFTALTAIVQSTFFTSLYYAGIESGWMYDISQGFMFGLSHIPIEGTTMLLLCRGIGKRAMVKSAIVGFCYGLFTWVCITLRFASLDERDNDYISETTGAVIYDLWTLSQVIFYLSLWLMPNRGIFTRRPAAVYWGRFFGLMRFGFACCEILNVFRLDFAYCLNRFLGIVIFCGFRVWVTYRTFFLDTLWWHGIPVDVPVFYGAKIGVPFNMSSVDFSNDGVGKPLEGVELSGDSALAMSSALDGFGRARGDSLNREMEEQYLNPNPNHQHQQSQARDRGDSDAAVRGSEEKAAELKKKTARSNSALGRKVRGFSAGSSGIAKRGKGTVPLLDFSRLEINTNRMLGVGSTARVYEGKWCGKKCAVKVLFTVEIVPEEIKRVMLEASLLHSLQNVSNNVTSLFGIAMLPPSICVVLELCNEGSLSDVLYVKNAATQHGKASDFKFKLPWEERLDLILGACEGLAAFAKVLPGYSHNDIKSANYLVHDNSLKDSTAESSSDILGMRRQGQTSQSSSAANLLSNLGRKSTKKNFVVKIADLEFASIGETPEHLHRVGNVANWTAPEVLGNKHPVSPASDVFSLAMTLYEIMVREVPFGDESNTAKNYLEGKRPIFPNLTSQLEEIEGNKASSSLLPPVAWTEPSACPPTRPSETSITEGKITPQEITSRKMIESIIVRAWAQDPQDRPDILSMTKEVKEIAQEYKMGLDIRDKNRRSTFKGNLLKYEDGRESETRNSAYLGRGSGGGGVRSSNSNNRLSGSMRKSEQNIEIELGGGVTNEI